MTDPVVTFRHAESTDVSFHPLCTLFPQLHGGDLKALADDIAANGVREPIVFLDGAILDGRNRYLIARDQGLAYPRRDFGSLSTDGDDPRAYVVSQNLARRHLTESQRAMIAGKLANMKWGRPAEKDANLHLLDKPAPVTNADAASMLNVSERSVASGRKVQEKAAPELVEAVERGEVAVSAAANIAETHDAEEQREAVAGGRDGLKAASGEARERKAKQAHVTRNTGKTEWYSPEAIVRRARDLLGGFDLDPASSEDANVVVGAARIFTAETDGLASEWPIGRTWMNPPYATKLVGPFCERFCEAAAKGSTGFVLVNNASETGWFQRLLSESAAVCFFRGRLRFICAEEGEKGTPLQGQALFYFGPEPERFASSFSELGVVLSEVRNA